ncbi:MAG: 4-(cytidine 5'-diphospho)-2-C-methyl-D-erythritol kinase [Parasphingorhabdus sp.]
MSQKDQNVGDSEIACAKINLALHVRKRLANGYHDIETVFAFLDHGDLLSVEPHDEITLSIRGPFAKGLSDKDNLVLDAARLLASHASESCGVRILLDKRLPIASGIGGGSADAAAALRLLNRYWATGLSLSELAELSAPLGADVPACVVNQTCIGKGIGQDLMPLYNGALAGHFVLLVNPLVPVSTASIFSDWDGVDRGALPAGSPLDIVLSGRNDLQGPAERLVPVIGDILSKLNETGALASRMSGSGATCFALYETEHQAGDAGKMINAALPDSWTMIGGLR